MGIIIRRGLGVGILATIAITSQTAQARFYGLSSGQVSSFTSTPDGCGISLLFDDFRAPREKPTKVPGAPARTFTLAASPDSRGRRMNFEIRGARLNAAAATIAMKIGGQQLTLRPKSDSYSIRTTARANSSSAGTFVQVALQLPEGAKPGDSLLNIDSIDVSLPGCPSQAGKH